MINVNDFLRNLWFGTSDRCSVPTGQGEDFLDSYVTDM